MILTITIMKEMMSREKEELLAVRSNLVLANLCVANLLRWGELFSYQWGVPIKWGVPI